MTGERQKFWTFKHAVIDLIPENAAGFLELEPHHMEACLQVAALYAAVHMEGIDFAAYAIEAYRAAEEVLIGPPPDEEPEPAPPPLTVLNGGKDGPRTAC